MADQKKPISYAASAAAAPAAKPPTAASVVASGLGVKQQPLRPAGATKPTASADGTRPPVSTSSTAPGHPRPRNFTAPASGRPVRPAANQSPKEGQSPQLNQHQPARGRGRGRGARGGFAANNRPDGSTDRTAGVAPTTTGTHGGRGQPPRGGRPAFTGTRGEPHSGAKRSQHHGPRSSGSFAPHQQPHQPRPSTTAGPGVKSQQAPYRPPRKQPSTSAARTRDDDTSGSDDDDDDDDEDIEAVFPPVSFLLLCPFADCPADTPPLTQPTQLTSHLSECHGVTFKNIHHMGFSIQKYLDAWATKLRGQAATGPSSSTSATIEGLVVVPPTPDHPRPQYFIDPGQCLDDLALRTRIQQEKLADILKTQERERRVDSQDQRKCLFCKHVCENRQRLFRHMFTEHNFNIGLPDNLVDVNEFLGILEGKLADLQCLYCEKTFTTAAVLRKHMRKKKHFKISARNRLYDRFYVINFLEPGKNWENFENEAYESDEERRDNADGGEGAAGAAWDDWLEEDGENAFPQTTACLFDDALLDSPAAACDHMRDVHGFDLFAIRRERDLDFYKTVALINYVRRQTAQDRCMACGTSSVTSETTVGDQATTTTGGNDLVAHMTANDCFAKVPAADHPMWEDVQYLFPTLEDDPLLIWFDDTPSDAEDEEEEEEDKEKKQVLETGASDTDKPKVVVAPAPEPSSISPPEMEKVAATLAKTGLSA
ncbi:hypothetical protein IWQ60_001129 [Tieghemiomyces parasiticus]|uniref:C2H2-type domain-containing protein n=1 Tax=Tieghemiomyces parasiticus TaxID=78921 RepID=A0A9W8AF53_9FUNG|nr:hypothetical protein IWQ60_001129 [Tieghemiomyces parasiticus]